MKDEHGHWRFRVYEGVTDTLMIGPEAGHGGSKFLDEWGLSFELPAGTGLDEAQKLAELLSLKFVKTHITRLPRP